MKTFWGKFSGRRRKTSATWHWRALGLHCISSLHLQTPWSTIEGPGIAQTMLMSSWDIYISSSSSFTLVTTWWQSSVESQGAPSLRPGLGSAWIVVYETNILRAQRVLCDPEGFRSSFLKWTTTLDKKGSNLVGKAASPSLSQSCEKDGNWQNRWGGPKVFLVLSFVCHSSFIQAETNVKYFWPELQTQRPQWQRDHSGQPWRQTLLMMGWVWIIHISSPDTREI